MKKVLFVLALVLAYGISVSTASAKMVIIDGNSVTVVADDNKKAPEGDKDKAKEAKATKSAGCGDKAVKAEGTAEAKSAGCGGKPKAEGTAAVKSAGCGDKAVKTAEAETSKDKKSEEGTE
jgi:hypothetical protein